MLQETLQGHCFTKYDNFPRNVDDHLEDDLLPNRSLHELDEEITDAITKLLHSCKHEINTTCKDPTVLSHVEFDKNKIYKYWMSTTDIFLVYNSVFGHAPCMWNKSCSMNLNV